jgi:hypothetical protein
MSAIARPTHVVVAGRIFVAALFLYVATAGGSLTSTDAVVTFELTHSLVDYHSIALPCNVLGLDANRGIDGRYYSQYGIGQSIYNIPFYVAGRVAERVTGLRVAKADSVTKALVAMGSTVAAAGTVATVFLLAWLIVGRIGPSVIAAAVCGIGSLLWPYARFGFNAPLAAWELIGAVTCLYAGIVQNRPRALAVAGAIVGAGCLTRHEFIPLAIPFIVLLCCLRRENKDRRLLLFLPGAIAGIALWAIYNTVRFGRPWIVGYSPLYSLSGAGYFGLLLSPYGSILLYSPAVILGLIGLVALARRDANGRTAALLLGVPALCLFLYYGALDDWNGGRSYGPRYLVPLLPLLSVPVGYLWMIASPHTCARRAIVATIALSALVQLPGVLVDYSRVSEAWARTVSRDELSQRLYRWSASPQLLDSKAAIETMPRLDFWWLHLLHLDELQQLQQIDVDEHVDHVYHDQKIGPPTASSNCHSAI